MSDKTVPHDADEYKDDDKAPRTDPSHVDNDPLVREAETDEDDEFPNRDDDEFTKRDLQEPVIHPDVQEDVEPDDPPRGESGEPNDVKSPIDPDASNN